VNFSRLITRSLRFYWRTGVVVALGVAVATAVITGSLVVGDSVTDSVRDTALARLGHIDHALTGSVLFRDDLAAAPQLKKPGRRIVPAIMTTGSARNPDTGVVVPRVDIIGVGDDFREMFDDGRPRLSGREVGFPPQDEAVFEGVSVFSFLSNSGDDISCLNLARPTFPRILGVGAAMIKRGGFRLSTSGPGGGCPWNRLRGTTQDGAIPVFGDADSVRWQLHSGPGKVIKMPRAGGGSVDVRVAGTIASSIFAGELLMSESNFRRTFPDNDAPRYFLIEAPPGREERVAEALRRNLGDMGLEVRTTREILNAVVGVQNTYISTFVALGGLGVVLGTFGLVIVLLRSALERRGEFALMLATGFGRGFLSRLLVAENAGLLCGGLLCGAVSALLAVAPQISSARSRINWPALALLPAAIVLIGLASCAVAARAAVRGNLIEALKEE